MTHPILITANLFAIATALPAVAIWGSNNLRKFLRHNWYIILLLLGLNLVLKLPLGAHFYHGMEYEDCYVHQAVGREFYYGQTSVQDEGSYVEGIWSVGSLHRGDYYKTFFNPIGYATVIYMAHQLFGDRPSAGHWVSLVASCLGVVVVFLLGYLIWPGRMFPIVSALIYSTLPVVNGNASTTSSEVFSSLYVGLAVMLSYLAFNDRDAPKVRFLAKVALASVLTFAVVCRRENTILLLLTPVMIWLSCQNEGVRLHQKLIQLAFNSTLILLIPCGFSVMALKLLSNYEQEVGAIAANPFDFTNFIALGPALVAALVDPSLYLCFGALLMFTPIVWFWQPAMRSVLLVLAVYLLAYTFHFRSYYFLQSYQANSFDLIRYLMNVSPLIALASAGATCLLWGMAKPLMPNDSHKSPAIVALGVAVMLSVAFERTINWRSEHTNEEQRLRVQPVLEAIYQAGIHSPQPHWIFTSLPCLFQIYGPPSLGIVDVDVAAELDPSLLNQILAGGQAYAFLTPIDLSAEDRFRYPQRTRWLDAMIQERVYDRKEGMLVRLRLP